MENNRKRFASAVLFIMVAGIAAFTAFLAKESAKPKTGESAHSAGSSEIGQIYTDLPEGSTEKPLTIKETSAGYYLYDKDGRPIMNDGIIDTGTDGQMEFNIECVNTCTFPLNYTLAILVNDCYQEADYERGGESFNGKGMLQVGASETVNAKFKIKSCSRNGDNELRIIMFFYTQDIPKDGLEQVVVGDSTGIYTLSGIIEDDAVTENNLRQVNLYDAGTGDAIRAVWLTEKECKSVPKYDFILDVKQEKTVYFNSMGEDKKYIGMLFIDGLSVKIRGEYVFSYKQKKGCLLSCKLTDKLKGGSTAFAHVYESGSRELEKTYTTNLYGLN